MLKRSRKSWLATASAVVLASAMMVGTASAGVIISNGTVSLGVNDQGHLNLSGVGVQFDATGNDGTFAGCECEGWGIGVVSTGDFGTASVDNSPGIANLSLVSFNNTATTATSVVNVLDVTGATTLRVTHEYTPSASQYLYQAVVTVENLSGSDIAAGDLLYRRAMDWDIEPTPFSEFVTIQGLPALLGIANGVNIFRTSDDGFINVNPLSGAPGDIGGCLVNANFTDCGPNDHGAAFDFQFDALAAGGSLSFTIFYGAAPTEALADAARALVGAGLYSYGQCNSGSNAACSEISGEPNTFIFGFLSSGGIFVPPPDRIPEPASLTLLGLGLAGLGWARRRRSA